MNREILFKAKRIDNGEWVKGYFYKIWNDCYIMWGMSNTMPSMIEVGPDTICQYTGLLDKNGIKIWENDIIRVTDAEGDTHFPDGGVGNVEFYDGLWYVNEEVSNGLYDVDKCYPIEVAGNIFDNPELLEV